MSLGRADDPHSVGRELDVRAILSGRITKRGDSLSVRAELIDVAKDAQIWGAQFSRTVANVVDVQEEIAKQVIDKLEGPSSAGNKTAKTPRKPVAPSVNKEAYQLYLRGMHNINKWDPESLRLGIDLCRQAIDLDPLYAPPYAGMGIAHSFSAVISRVDTEHAFRQGKAYARRAIELDESLGEAHAALSISHTFCDFNVADGLREAKRAVELDPNSSSARYCYAQTLASAGRLDEGLEIARQGCELDPLMAPIQYCYGLLLNYAKRWEEAELQLRRTLEINPNFFMAEVVRAMVLARMGRFAEAMGIADKFGRGTADRFWDLIAAYVAALAGERAKAESILAKTDSASPAAAAYVAATVYGVFGDFDKAFAELERARDLRFGILVTAMVNPALETLHSDPRWIPFLKSLNLGIDLPQPVS